MQTELRKILVYAFYAFLSITFCLSLFDNVYGLGNHDWDQHQFYYASVLKSVIEYHQWPFWNPWYCGGNVLWQNPQVAILTPVYILGVFFPFVIAVKISIVLHYFCGFLGMHFLCTRLLKLKYFPLILYLAAFFVFSGSLALHIKVGHSTFLPFFYLPWIVYHYFKINEKYKYNQAFKAAAWSALAIYNGGIHSLAMLYILLGILALYRSLKIKQFLPLKALFAVIIPTIAISSPKLIPVLYFLVSKDFVDDRLFTPVEFITNEILVNIYTNRNQSMDFVYSNQQFGWWEYGNYLGILGVLLVIGFMVTITYREATSKKNDDLSLYFCLLVFLSIALAAGDFSALSPASLVKNLPIYSGFRCPTRYTILVGLFGSLVIGSFLSQLKIDHFLAQSFKLRMVVGVTATLATYDLYIVNKQHFVGAFDKEPLAHEFKAGKGVDVLRYDSTGAPLHDNVAMLRNLFNDTMHVQCYEPLQLIRRFNSELPVVFVGQKTDVHSKFTPNQIVAEVNRVTNAPIRVYLNQNFSEGWTGNGESLIWDEKKGHHYFLLQKGAGNIVEFSFFPPGLRLGLGLFVIGIIGSVVLWHRRI